MFISVITNDNARNRLKGNSYTNKVLDRRDIQIELKTVCRPILPMQPEFNLLGKELNRSCSYSSGCYIRKIK
jgi:hypothetical protein